MVTRQLPAICLLAILSFSCQPRSGGTGAPPSEGAERAGQLARTVTIHRDRFGIPHVFAPTDAGAVFGFAYAQSEDNFPRLEDDFIRALGRAAEVHGEEQFAADRLNRALEIPRLARAEYSRMDTRTRALVDAFAAGVNYFLATHPEVRPRLLTRMEPWYPLAFIRYNYFQNGFAQSSGIRRAEWRTAEERGLSDNIGSNGWVIGPQKSASGHTLLFINPHLSFFGPGQVYEGHVRSDEGWNFTGYTRFGFPFPYVGHNGTLGWVSTDNSADLADLYRERFDDPARPLAYRYGDGYKMAQEWRDTIRVRAGNVIQPRVVTLRKTHHGPIVAERQGSALALRMAKLDGDGWLAEWYAMTRARTVAELKQAMGPLDMLFGNVMAADSAGHTWYLYNGAIPRRDSSFDWSEPLDGSDPTTEWQGYHTIDELPQLWDPPSGWMENCNSSPFRMTNLGNVDERKFPRYMVPEGTEQNARSQASHRLLRTASRITLDDLARMAFDTHVIRADTLLPRLFAAMEAAPDSFRALVTPAVDELRQWNRSAEINSVGMTLFDAWHDLLPFNRELSPPEYVSTLATALNGLEQKYGTWRTAWGEVARLQRVNEFDSSAARPGDVPFRDDRPSLPLKGAMGQHGAVFTVYPVPFQGRKKRYGVAGGSYVSVVEFGPKVRAYAVHTFGASGNPASPHFTDQAPLYARGEFRPAWFTPEEILANVERSYRPGER